MAKSNWKVRVRALFAILFLVGWIVMLQGKWGSLPQIGMFFNPFVGFWQNAEAIDAPRTEGLPETLALKDSVYVRFDDRGVPHIKAQNEADLYRVQGYLEARDRLWQMELQIRAAGGRLSEWVGPVALPRDRYMRRIGMRYAAEQALDSLQNDPALADLLQAYADGVNARIAEMNPADYPLEYKVMGITPEPWNLLKSMLLMKQLTYTLAGRSNDVRRTLTRAWQGRAFLKQFFDGAIPGADPIISNAMMAGNDFAVRPPDPPKDDFESRVAADISAFQPDPLNGSNNWAVSGSRTATGAPLLANDPHLGLTLPSIWYEVQLTTPEYNTYGVSFPGAPGVILGFNENIAWGSTNVGADVMDYYEIEFRDSTMSEYRYDGSWQQVHVRSETLQVRGGEPEILKIPFTHHGPVVRSDSATAISYSSTIPVGYALRWEAHDRSDIFKTFYLLNHARNYEDYREALTYFNTPAQNLVYADQEGNIALWVTGKFPLKWDGQGRLVSDGSNPKYDWQGWIPFEDNPHTKNPKRGFVSSANQRPAGSDYPYYLDDRFGPYERGNRINETLSQLENATPESLQQLQTDVLSLHARTLLPVLLDELPSEKLSPIQQRVVDSLRSWDYRKTPESLSATLFNRWWDALYDGIWSDEYDQAPGPVSWPARDVVVKLISDHPDSKWMDDITTPQTETLQDIAWRTFQTVVPDTLIITQVPRWAEEKAFRVPHLANIPGLSSERYDVGGDAETVNAIRGSHGPSWRMVVSLEDTVKGYGVYPGGPSGNPGSPYYNNSISDWANGRLPALPFYHETSEWTQAGSDQQWLFKPEDQQ
jgi:penicillin amidase